MPIPAGKKHPPPPRLTGQKEEAQKAARSEKTWRKAIKDYLEDDDFSAWNTGIRLPPNVFALDVDEYEKENGVVYDGWESLERFAEAHDLGDPAETLPKTIRLTSRGYRGRSGQLFFRIPDVYDQPGDITNLFPGDLCPGVQVVRPGHRYTMEAGSLHPEGGVYKLYDQRSKRPAKSLEHGFATLTPEELPELPEAWLGAILETSPGNFRDGDDFDGAPDSDEARSHAAEALSEWLSLYEPEDGSRIESRDELMQELSPSARQRVLAFGDGSRNNANISTACIALLATLMEDARSARTAPAPPVREAVDLAKRLYIQNGNVQDRPREFDRALVWAFPLAKQAAEENDLAVTLSQAQRILEDDFWSQSEVLRSCRSFARSRSVSPRAMLGAAIALASAWLPPHLVLPPLVGSVAGLNFYVAIAASSGGGKSTAIAAAKDWLNVQFHQDMNPQTDEPEEVTVATGQGLIQAYVTTIPAKAKSHTVGKPNYIQYKRSVYFVIDEITTLAASTSSEGSMLKEFLKTMWTGSGISMVAAEVTRSRKLKSHTFRASIIANVQPSTAHVILDGHGDGFPQRWMWVEAYDENPLSDDELDECELNPPEPLSWIPPRAPYPLNLDIPDDDSTSLLRPSARIAKDDEEFEVLEVTQSIKAKVRQAARGGRRIGETDVSMDEVLDGHSVLLQEKLAAILAALHGHIGINDRFERMAEWLTYESDETRRAIMRERTEESAKEMEARAVRQGRAEAVAEEVREMTTQERFEERVYEKMREAGGEMSMRIAVRVLNLARVGGRAEQVATLEAIDGIKVEDDTVILESMKTGEEDV